MFDEINEAIQILTASWKVPYMVESRLAECRSLHQSTSLFYATPHGTLMFLLISISCHYIGCIDCNSMKPH